MNEITIVKVLIIDNTILISVIVITYSILNITAYGIIILIIDIAYVIIFY